MKPTEIESEVIKVITSFQVQGKPTFDDLPKDAHLISLSQEFNEDELLEAGLFGYLDKVVSVNKPDSYMTKESSTEIERGYLFITSERLRFITINSSWGNRRIEKTFNWSYQEFSSVGCEVRKALRRDVKVL